MSTTIRGVSINLETLAQMNYREMIEEDKRKGSILMDNPILKEVKGKMDLQLIDVIFFNKKTEKIDYRKDIVAQDPEEAYMIAANDFGKYNSKVHIRRASCILGFRSLKDELED